MNANKRIILNLLVAIAMVVGLMPSMLRAQPAQAAGSISLTTLGTPYTQDFNTLASSGTSSTVPTGWDFAEIGTNANITYTAGTGSSTTGDTYSFGASGSTERAFGGLLSGSLNPTIGASFTNNTGATIARLAIAYTGEQWRMGATGRVDRIDFQYSTSATSLTTGAWTDVDSLDFSSPTTSGTVGQLDGNATANRTALNYTIMGLDVPNGAIFWIRWTDYNPSGSDDGLAVDDFSLTPDGGVTPTPPTGTGSAIPASVVAGGTTLLTVAVTPGANPASTGLAVAADLSSIGGSAAQTLFDNATNGDATAGDNVFSFQATVASGTTGGAKSLPATITDAELRTGTTTIALTVLASTDPTGTGTANPNLVAPGDATLLTVVVTPGANPASTDLQVAGDLTAIGGVASQAFYDDGSHGDVTVGDNTFSFQATVAVGTTDGNKSIPVTLADGQARTGTTAIALTVQTTPPAGGDVVISQIYGGGGNAGAFYKNDFIELYNRTSNSIDLSGWSVQYASATGTGAWQVTALAGTIAPGKYYLVQEAAGNSCGGVPCGAANLPTPDSTGTINLGGSAGKIALVNTTTALSGACPASATIVDLVGYGSSANCSEGSPSPGPTNNTLSLSRKDNGATDTNVNSSDFATGFASPHNSSWVSAAPAVASTSPANGATDVALNANIVVTFTEPVSVTVNWYTISCASSSVHAATFAGGPQTFVLTPTTSFANNESCTVTVIGAQVNGLDPYDPQNTMAADSTFNFTTVAPVCELPFTPIYQIQGSGTAAAITGLVTTQGVVVGDNEGPQPALRGFYLQDVNGDGDLATSDGIFVFNGTNDSVSLGQVVRVTGTAEEFQGQTQISSLTSIINCNTTATVTPVDVNLPFSSSDDPERFEGMLVRLPQTLYVTEHYQLGRFGEVLLSANERLKQPTNVVAPGAPALALQAANDLDQILMDDASQAQNPDPIVFGRGGNPLSASNTLRGGDTATGIVGIMTYTWGGNSASPNAYRVRPINAMGGGVPNFQPANPRPATAPNVGGTVRVVGMNLLNFFNTFDGASSSPPYACTLGVGGALTDCRGADDAAEFDRQWQKTVVAIVGMDADVIGLVELENDGYGSDSAIQDLVNRLNTATAPGTYAFIDVDGRIGQINALGTDAIKGGLIYKPARVTPAGATAALNTDAFVNGGDSAARNRPALAQAFEQNSNGARFVISVNHLKSKGSACDTPDAGDGQGNCNAVRTNAANLLTAWLASDPTGTGDPDALIVGDLNSYAKEDPITAIKNSGYVNLPETLLGADAYSYVFDGQWGYLDHALASASLAAQVSGVAEWHINSDEPSVLDYNTNFKTPSQQASLYNADQYRISDHDPVIVGLDLNAPPTVSAGGPYSVSEGGSAVVAATGSDPDNGALTYDWDLDNNGSFETPGQSVSYTGIDGPAAKTIKVQVTDIGGLTAVAETTVTINNVPPTVGPIAAPIGAVKVGTPVNASAGFTDPGTLDTHTAAWDWGDGSTSTGTVNETNGSGSANGSHTYSAAGLYTVRLAVTDKDGGPAQSVFRYVVVYDPNAGAVTGAGWINSPTGAYTANPTWAGKAIVAFYAQYYRNLNTPIGLTAFQLRAGNLSFYGAAYQWLVIAGPKAELRGSGKINGHGDYGFLVSVIDGKAPGGGGDKFRIKIWDKATSNVIYDNQMGAPDDADATQSLVGSIVIYK